ncbi:MAG: hypothetical protein EOM80_08425 [Erysipelotrichia bacterium]|nr:hypothetical protein [Erysipelotrichia bacterium]
MKKLAMVFCCLLMTACVFADNADLTPEEAYGRIFASDTTALSHIFDDGFLSSISEEKIIEIAKYYKTALGNLKKVEHKEKSFKLLFEKGHTASTISINANNKISSLWFGVPEQANDSFEEIIKTLKQLPDKVSICLIRHDRPESTFAEGQVIAELNADTPMGCGSAFKLFLLKAIEDEIAAGKRTWTDVVELKEEWKSFPSGILQEWHAGSRHTLETIAGLMISISDNTATDHIFNTIGRDNLRKYFPESCKDIFNTSQMLKMKFYFPDKAKAFIKADTAGKTEILNEIDAILPNSIASYSILYSISQPAMIDELEWFVSTRKLCETIYSLKESKIIKINPANGIVDKKDWHMVGFKGGSEPGVLNYTWVLQKTQDGPFYTFSCSANNSSKPVATDQLNTAAIRTINLLSQQK